MYQPFHWMFKHPNFKEHYFYIIKKWLLLLLLEFICWFIAGICIIAFGEQPIARIIAIVMAILSFIAVISFIPGYYWELVENIINRGTDIAASPIYNGKIRTVEKITLPELNMLRFIWRGFASMIASVLMLLPFFALFAITLYSLKYTNTCISDFNILLSFSSPFMAFVLLAFLYVPLLWNYAAKDSVVAVFNIRKAIYIIGNYPFRYLRAIVLMIFTNVIYYIIGLLVLYVLSNICLPFLPQQAAQAAASILHPLIMLPLLVYYTFIQAYLLGTLTPVGDTE